MTDIDFLFTFLFRVLAGSYFVSTGLNFLSNLASQSLLLQQNILVLATMFSNIEFDTIVSGYAHLLVVIGTAFVFGFRSSKYLAIICVLINYFLMSTAAQRCFLGIKLLFIVILIMVDLKAKKLGS